MSCFFFSYKRIKAQLISLSILNPASFLAPLQESPIMNLWRFSIALKVPLHMYYVNILNIVHLYFYSF